MENMKPWEVIKLIEETPSRNAKIEILKSQSSNHEFKFGLIACYDPYVTYGVKQIPEKTEEKFNEIEARVGHIYSSPSYGENQREDQVWKIQPQPETWKIFDGDLLKQLRNRMKTGNAAKEHIQYHMDCTETLDEWNYWYRRILQKDMKCGITAKSINTAYGNLIKTFGVHLAAEGAGKENLMGESIIEYKYDGVRCIAVVKDNKVTYYTRNGKEINKNNLPDSLHDNLNRPEFQGLVFDGELMSQSFQELMQRIHRRYQWDVIDMYYAIFDVLPYDEFVVGKSKLPLYKRKEMLDNLARDNPDFFWESQLQFLYWEPVDLRNNQNRKKLMHIFRIAQQNKFEGIIIKDKDSLWEAGRNNSWLKMKPFIEVSLKVVDIEEGTGKNEGVMGNIIVQGSDMGKKLKCNVGSGFTDKQRKEIWDNKEKYMGMVAEVRADTITDTLTDGAYSLRFPRFKGWRGSKPGEKI